MRAVSLVHMSVYASRVQRRCLGASKTHFKKEKAQFGKFAFTAEETGSHHICFSNKGRETTRVGLDVKVGVAAKDYSEVAKKEHLEPLQVELRRLEDAAREIHEEQLYMRQREEEMRHQRVDELTFEVVQYVSHSNCNNLGRMANYVFEVLL